MTTGTTHLLVDFQPLRATCFNPDNVIITYAPGILPPKRVILYRLVSFSPVDWPGMAFVSSSKCTVKRE